MLVTLLNSRVPTKTKAVRRQQKAEECIKRTFLVLAPRINRIIYIHHGVFFAAHRWAVTTIMGQCRSALTEMVPSFSPKARNRQKMDELQDSQSEFGGGRRLLGNSDAESTGSSFRSSKNKKKVDYYGGTIGDDILEEEQEESKG